MKGFYFTVDALIAFAFASIVITSVLATSRSPLAIPFAPGLLAQSSLESMDALGNLRQLATLSDSAGAALVAGDLGLLVPSSLGANLTVRVYYYETGSSCVPACRVGGSSPIDSFCLCSLYSVNASIAANSSWTVVAKRMAYSLPAGKFVLANLEVWPK